MLFFSSDKEPFITEAPTMSSLYIKHSLRCCSMGGSQCKQTWMLACSQAVKCVIRDVSSFGGSSLYPRRLFSFHTSSFLLIKHLTLSSNLGEILMSKWFYSFLPHVDNKCTKIHVEISCVISSVWRTWVRMKWLHAKSDLIWNTEAFH